MSGLNNACKVSVFHSKFLLAFTIFLLKYWRFNVDNKRVTFSSTLLRLEFGEEKELAERREREVFRCPPAPLLYSCQNRPAAPANQQQVVLRNIRQQLRHPWMTHGSVARGIRKEKESQEMEKTKAKNKIKNQS